MKICTLFAPKKRKLGIEYVTFLGALVLVSFTKYSQIALLDGAFSAPISFMKIRIKFAPLLHQKKIGVIYCQNSYSSKTLYCLDMLQKYHIRQLFLLRLKRSNSNKV